MHRLLLITTLPLALSSCALTSKSGGSDFSVKGVASQHIPAGEATILLVRCYCPEIILKRTDTAFVDVNVEAVYDSVGYHGKQSQPSEIPQAALQFKSHREEQILVLESHEYTHMHHALLVKHLALSVPAQMEVRIVQIPYKQLEGRALADDSK